MAKRTVAPSKALARAIKLREWTRTALTDHGETDSFVIDLNKKADVAYEALSPEDSALYREWAFPKLKKKRDTAR